MSANGITQTNWHVCWHTLMVIQENIQQQVHELFCFYIEPTRVCTMDNPRWVPWNTQGSTYLNHHGNTWILPTCTPLVQITDVQLKPKKKSCIRLTKKWRASTLNLIFLHFFKPINPIIMMCCKSNEYDNLLTSKYFMTSSLKTYLSGQSVSALKVSKWRTCNRCKQRYSLLTWLLVFNGHNG